MMSGHDHENFCTMSVMVEDDDDHGISLPTRVTIDFLVYTSFVANLYIAFVLFFDFFAYLVVNVIL